MVLRNETRVPIVTRASDWSCTDNGGKFRYSGGGAPGTLTARLDPGAEITRPISLVWDMDPKETREPNGDWILGRFQFSLYQDNGGRLVVLPIDGRPALPMAMVAGRRVNRGFVPIPATAGDCPRTLPLTMAGGEAATLTVSCGFEQDGLLARRMTVAPR